MDDKEAVQEIRISLPQGVAVHVDPHQAEPEEAAESNGSQTHDWSDLSLDFVKFMVSGLGFGMVLLGYSYSHTFFRSFGLSLFQLKLSSVDIVYRGIALVEIPLVLAGLIAVVCLSALMMAVRAHVPPVAGIVLASAAVTLMVAGVLALGRSYGEDHAKQIWAGEAGKLAFCSLKEKPENALWDAISGKIDTLGLEHRLKLIHRNKETIYLAPQLLEVPAGRRTGESYVFDAKDILFCRIVGS